MICRLCLKDIAEVINIFDEFGIQLKIAIILAKYFWFEPKIDDPISKAVCDACWIKVLTFHEFYLEVEDAHRRFAERLSIKTEEQPSHANETKIEFGEERFSVDLYCEAAILKEDINKLDTKRFGERNVPLQACDIDDEVKLFEGAIFMEDFPDDTLEFIAEETDVLADLRGEHSIDESQMRRSQRQCVRENDANTQRQPSRSRQTLDTTSLNTNKQIVEKGDVMPAKKRRGRPPKSVTESNKTCVVIESGNTSQKETKSRDADAKIAQHMILTCDICAQDQSTFAVLRKHMLKMHHCKAYAVCCNKKFYKRALLMYHIEKHINPDVYRCDECDRVFADKQCMRNHFLLKHQPDEVKTFQCEHCPKKFAKSYLLEHHRVVHEERTHICEVCKKGFPSWPLLSAHIKVIHENYGTMCDICAKIIRGRSLFARHMLEHTGIPVPKVQCDKCGSWHKDKFSLQKHKRRHNDDGTVHVCNICDKVSPNRSALLSHKRYVHASDRSFECTVCNKAFKKAINLKEHMTMHTGEVLYKCAHCAKTFNSNANMHSHRKKMHPQEFEETRKQRLENASKPAPRILATTDTADPTCTTPSTEEANAAPPVMTARRQGAQHSCIDRRF